MGTVLGLFETREKAERAVEALRAGGFRKEEIGLVMRDRGLAGDVEADAASLEAAAGTSTGAAAGAVGGGLLGSLAGLAVGIGALAIPGIGPVLAAGPIAAIIAGGAIGVATGGLIGSLVEAGIPQDEAGHYQSGVERGGILVTVHVNGREDEARRILESSGLRSLDEHRSDWEQDPNFTYERGNPARNRS